MKIFQLCYRHQASSQAQASALAELINTDPASNMPKTAAKDLANPSCPRKRAKWLVSDVDSIPIQTFVSDVMPVSIVTPANIIRQISMCAHSCCLAWKTR
jgi:hypothetical protein